MGHQKIFGWARDLRPTGYYCRLYTVGTTAVELEEVKQYHGRIATWALTVTTGANTFGVGQGKDAGDAVNNLVLTTRKADTDPPSLIVKASGAGTPILLEIWYWEDL